MMSKSASGHFPENFEIKMFLLPDIVDIGCALRKQFAVSVAVHPFRTIIFVFIANFCFCLVQGRIQKICRTGPEPPILKFNKPKKKHGTVLCYSEYLFGTTTLLTVVFLNFTVV